MSDKVDLEKLRSIGSLTRKGTSKTTVVDQRGSTTTEHWNGKVDAQVCPEAITLKVSPKGS